MDISHYLHDVSTAWFDGPGIFGWIGSLFGRRKKNYKMTANWGYGPENGPHAWCSFCDAANGLKQSPIDIITSECEFNGNLGEFNIKYLPEKSDHVMNNGKTVVVEIDGNGSALTGGPLKSKYKIAQFHFHWGKNSSEGSEHRIDGKPYSAELHLVHWDCERFSSFSEALADESGLAVLGVLIKCGKENQAFSSIAEKLWRIRYKNQQVKFGHDGFDPASLLPKDKKQYWHYMGSLTTPPCTEAVAWTLFKEPIEFSEDQLAAMRKLANFEEENSPPEDCIGQGLISQNFRPPQSLNNRKVYKSFKN